MGADTLLGNDVYDKDGEDLAEIKEFVSFTLDVSNVCPEGRAGFRQGSVARDVGSDMGQRYPQVLRHALRGRLSRCVFPGRIDSPTAPTEVR